MEGLTTRDGTTFPALGLRAEATTATACSHMYKNVVEAVKLELQTIQASGESPELDVDRIELSLLHDPVVEAASVCLYTSVLPPCTSRDL